MPASAHDTYNYWLWHPASLYRVHPWIRAKGPLLVAAAHQESRSCKGDSECYGGIAVALALSLPANEYKPTILTITYAVVLFSIIVQGFTIKPLVERLVAKGPIDDD